MKTIPTSLGHLGALALCSALLSACGGGGDSGGTAATGAGSLMASLEEGVYTSNKLLENCTACDMSYTKIRLANSKAAAGGSYTWSGTAWQKDPPFVSNRYMWDGSDWQLQNTCQGAQASFVAESKSVVAYRDCTGLALRMVADTQDASGKTLADLGLATPADIASARMPAGGTAHKITWTTGQDSYSLDSPQWPTPYSGLNAFISDHTTPTTVNGKPNPVFFNTNSFTFDAGGTSTGGTLTVWKYPSSVDEKLPVTASYTFKELNSKNPILVIHGLSRYQAADSKIKAIYGIREGTVYLGTYEESGRTASTTVMTNRTMMDAVLKASGKATTVD